MSNSNPSTDRHAPISRLRWVPISDIRINPQAQRELNHGWAATIAANFDPDVFFPLVLSLRDGRYYCIDGQHRVEAFKIMGWTDQQVQCWVYEGLTEEAESDFFLKLQEHKPVPRFEKFTISVNANRDVQSDINRIVLSHGLKIGRGNGAIGAVAALEKVYGAGAGVLSRTLTIIRDAYGDEGFDADVIKGLGLVCARYNGQVDDKNAIARLGAMRGGVNGLLAKARATHRTLRKPMPACVASSVVEVLNQGRGGKKLPDWFKAA